MKRFLLLIITSALLTGCGGTQHLQTLPIELMKEVTKTDTIYINNVQFDSIYVSQDKYTDRSRDTILIKENCIEYRYKLLRDTIERVKIETVRDSIPYEVRIVETREVYKPPNLFDYVSYLSFVVLIMLLIWRFKYIVKTLSFSSP